MSLNLSLLKLNPSAAESYKTGYEDCEIKYKNLQKKYDIIISQLNKLGYEIGESPSILRSASFINKECKSHVSCETCDLYNKKNEKCTLSGDNPSNWRIQ